MKKFLFTLRIVWVAILFSQGPLFFVLYSQPDTFFDFSQSIPGPQLALAFAVMAVLTLSIIIPKKLLIENIEEFNRAVDMGKMKKEMTLPILERLFIPLTIRLALLEAVALFGFSIAFFTKNIAHYFYFACIMLIAYALSFPSKRFLSRFFGGYQFQ
ncbi:MAG TPA: hypothetical protein PKC21_07210 [Oligoflexia bacterium]|nr:hypothetical protein [Oligoflexia bacterium]HMR25126.1 hypothetical protein [Oligoflexia bacterium]